MKNITLFLIFTFIGFASAQSISITGTLVDKSEFPQKNVLVYLLKAADKSIVATVFSDENGNFIFKNTPKNEYFISILIENIEVFQKKIALVNGDITLGKIVLEPKINELKEVVITNEKPMIEVRADKTIFNVSNALNATGTNVWELLRKAPGVIIDNNGGIILEGKTGVQIFIDGKATVLSGQELQSFLQALQSSTIDKLEIITQPSSKYDAAGTAGIINIVFKKDKNLGINGTVSNAVTIGDFARNSASTSFNYRNKKNNFYGNASNAIGRSTGFINLKRQQNDKEFDAKTVSVYDPKSTNVRLGYDYFANAKNTFGIIINSNFYSADNESNSRTPIQAFTSATIDSVLVAQNNSKTSSENNLLNLNYKYSDTLETNFNIDLDYGKFNREGYAYQPNFYFDASENSILSQSITAQETPIDISILSFQSDYERKLFGGKVSSGVKISNVNTNNTFNFFNLENELFVLDETQSNQFEYQENINAAYINFYKKVKKWSFQFGLRMENTVSKGALTQAETTENQIVKRNYADWFPSGGLTYQLNEKNQLALNYSKRIQRPNYSSLNPFIYKIDELSFSRGNPFLQPQYTNNIKLSNTYNYKLTTSISYSFISDFFAQVTEAEGENQNYLTPQNIANQEVINLGVSFPQKINNWWNTYFSLNAFTSSYKSSNPDFVNITQNTISFYTQSSFTLPKEINFEISGWYSSPSVWSGTYVTKSIGSLNLAFQKKFLDNKLAARIAFNDVLFTSPWRGTTRFGIVSIDGTGGNDSRNATFSLSYSFGSKEVKKSRNRKTSLEDEKDRVN